MSLFVSEWDTKEEEYLFDKFRLVRFVTQSFFVSEWDTKEEEYLFDKFRLVCFVKESFFCFRVGHERRGRI